MADPLRIGLVSEFDLADPYAWSGTIVPMRSALEAVADVVPLPVARHNHLLERAMGRASLRSHRGTYVSSLGPLSLKARAHRLWADVEPRWQRGEIDVLVALASSASVAWLPPGPPVVQVVDATFRGLVDFYPDYSRLHPLSLRQGDRMMRRSMQRTASFVVNNAWGAEQLSAEGFRGTIRVARFGPVTPVTGVGVRNVTGPLRVLVVARDWERKGGDDAVAAVAALRASGVSATLTVVGQQPDDLPVWATALGPVGRDTMSELYASHDVLLELSRANAAGTTLTDAAAHGLAAVATDVGGVASIVEDGITGLLVTPSPGVVDTAMASLQQLADPDLRAWVAAAAKAHQQAAMTWPSWAGAVAAACRSALEAT